MSRADNWTTLSLRAETAAQVRELRDERDDLPNTDAAVRALLGEG